MTIDWGLVLQKILMIIIEMCLPIALAQLVAWLNARSAEARAMAHKHNLDTAMGLVYQFVLAAEQCGITGAILNEGAEKKKFVLNLVETELAARGIKIDLDTLDAMIEGAVHEAFNKFELPFGPAPATTNA
jgi:hypothetical protein